MNIAIFTDNFLPGVGGTENAVLNFATGLVSKGNKVIVFAPDYRKNFVDNFPFGVVRIKSVKVTKNDCCALCFLDKRARERFFGFKADIVQTETMGPVSGFGIKLAKKNGVKTVSTIHTKYSYCYDNAVHFKFLSRLICKVLAKPLKRADVVCAVSEDLRSEIEGYGINKDITVIKNGGIARNNKTERKQNPVFSLLFVGLLVKYKNIGFSLLALKRVKERGYRFVFNIVGGGKDVKYFKRLVKKYGLEENVFFLGKITDSVKLDTVYADADLFLFPSVFDNDPLVVCEAGNTGTPSLVLENTGASERITDGVNGFTSPNDIEKFTDKIIFLMENKDKLRTAGENAKKLFTSWDDNTEKYLEIYKEQIADGGR